MEFELYSHPNHKVSCPSIDHSTRKFPVFIIKSTNGGVNQKRNRDQILQSSSQTPPTWVASQPEPSTGRHQAHSSPFHFTVPTLRYEGDGLDFRSPIMSTSRQEVIDLTGDGSGQPGRSFDRMSGSRPAARLPRTPPPPLIRDVISIDDHDDTAGGHVTAASPELELLFSRTLLPTTMPYSRPHSARPPLNVGGPSNPPIRSVPNYSHISGSRPSWAEWRSHGQRRRRYDMAISSEELYRQRQRQQENLPRVPPGLVEEILNNRDSMFINASPDMTLPDQLNFIAQGFAMGPGAQAAGNARARPPPPTYDPPSPPRAGYTRDPKEDDILLCPNCDQELGVGEDEIKKQVWVIKKCGHV